MQEIFDKVNEALYMRGDDPITSLNTIRNDKLSIESRWHIVVEEIRKGRNIRYRYEDPNFSIFNTPLNSDEIDQLMQSVTLLRKFEGMPGFEWVNELNARLQTTVSTEAKPVIGFDSNKELKGMAFFTPLFKSITAKESITIKYCSFRNDKVFEGIVYPYYLKEYNQRWFLFAMNDSHRTLSCFALDRIKAIGKSTAKFIPNSIVDFEHYFENVIGVTVHLKEEPQPVVLWTSKEQLPYMLSKPLHHSQTIIEKREDGSAVISINIVPTFELEQLILSFGERVKIFSPVSLRDKILERIKKNMQNYE